MGSRKKIVIKVCATGEGGKLEGGDASVNTSGFESVQAHRPRAMKTNEYEDITFILGLLDVYKVVLYV